MINLKNIHKSFKNQVVLNGCNLSAQLGDLVHISGPNGSGKSTLLFIFAGLLEADEGSMHFDNPVNIGALIENPEFADYSTIKDNLSYLLKLINQVDETHAVELCRNCNLDYYDKKVIKNFSVGMKQKVGIIQAIMEDQNLVLLDEPTRGLDDESKEVFVNLINEMTSKTKATVIITSHDEIVGLNYTSSYRLDAGQIIELQS